MSKYRFTDGHMVCSECCGHGDSIADIITYDLKKEAMMEIEIKISKQDLKHDIKKMKHEIYRKKDLINIQKFYYAVPTFMVEYCKNYLEENNLDYGVIEIIEEKVQEFVFDAYNDTAELMKVVKRCKKFNNNSPLERQKHSFFSRLSTEVVARSRELLQIDIKNEVEQ